MATSTIKATDKLISEVLHFQGTTTQYGQIYVRLQNGYSHAFAICNGGVYKVTDVSDRTSNNYYYIQLRKWSDNSAPVSETLDIYILILGYLLT